MIAESPADSSILFRVPQGAISRKTTGGQHRECPIQMTALQGEEIMSNRIEIGMTSVPRRGMHHLGLGTHDMEATLDFYENVLGFPARVCEIIEPETGGKIRHAFLDAGHGELIAFMECNEVPGVEPGFDTGINRGLGIRGGLIHFAFKVLDEGELATRQAELREKGVEITDVVDHGWCKSIYFKDPNGLQLEFCCLTTELDATHTAARTSDTWTRWARR